MKYHTSVLLKPSSSRCNLNCTYCFYLKKQEIYPWTDHPTLSLKTFETFLRQYIPLSSPYLTFLWQGGEPTMMGLSFFESALEMEKQIGLEMANGSVSPVMNNAIQTNATLLNDDWAKFFKKWRFLVGVSIDGPPEWHDKYRKDLLNRGTHDRVKNGVEYLKRHEVPFNVLTVINQRNVTNPREMLYWLVEQGFMDLQFIPCVEMQPNYSSITATGITEESITPEQYAQFLNTLLDVWIEIGVDKLRIRWMDNIIQMLWGFPSEMCHLARNCGYIVLEHNGDCYPCDFRVENEWFLGNINETSLQEIIQGEKFTRFSKIKSKLHPDCLECSWKTLCYGECPSYRTINVGQAEYALPYFCSSFKTFFEEKYGQLEKIAINTAKQRGMVIPSGIMPASVRTRTKPISMSAIHSAAKKNNVGRNGPCPCNSGKKFKLCCGSVDLPVSH